jgi:hypothetical protein
MVKNLLVVAALASGVVFSTPFAASATPLCEQASVSGIVNASTPLVCVPYPLADECTSGEILLGIVGKIDDHVCVPAL